MIFLPSSQGASSSASGTRVVLPAPGGATSTAALLSASVRASSSSTASMGRGVAELRGNEGLVSGFSPSPLVGEGGFAKRIRVRGSLRGYRPLIRRYAPPSPTRG